MLLVLALLAALVAVPSSVANATIVVCPGPGNACLPGIGDDYPYKNRVQDSGSGYGGYFRECTDFVAWRLNRDGAPGWYAWGNANRWDDTARTKGVRVDRVPALGAVAEWESNHVAYVAGWNSTHSMIFIEEYNYGLTGTYSSRWIPASSPSNYLHVHDLVAGPPSDGSYVAYNGAVYVVAGGAPIYVSNWAHVGGDPGTTRVLSAAEFAALRQYPVDGTYIAGHQRGEVYVVAGGSPIYIGDPAMLPGHVLVGVDDTAVDNAGAGSVWDHLSAHPFDGTYIAGHKRGEVYVVAGGAPVYIGDPGMLPGHVVVGVDDAAIDNAGGAIPWQHLAWSPADGTYIAGVHRGEVYVVAGRAPIYISNPAMLPGHVVIGVDDSAVDNAGAGAVWNHLSFRPVDGTWLAAGANRYRVAAGAPILTSPGQAGTIVDPVAILNAGAPSVWAHLNAPPGNPVASPPAVPNTTITSGPPSVAAAGSVKIAFKSSTAHSTFQCRWDAIAWQACTSPVVRNVTSAGRHTFVVRAVAAGGFDATPSLRSFTTRSLSVDVTSTAKASKLVVDVNPNWAAGNYLFTVERLVNSLWVKTTTAATSGVTDVRVLDLPRGTYRVRVPLQRGFAAVVSRPVVLLK